MGKRELVGFIGQPAPAAFLKLGFENHFTAACAHLRRTPVQVEDAEIIAKNLYERRVLSGKSAARHDFKKILTNPFGL